MRPTPIVPSVDFSRNGIQHGFLRLPHSDDNSAWGSVTIPITVAKNGDGATALLTGANHGDEYEGAIALFNFARTISIDDLSGRVIIVPAMNYPAFRAGTRTSPIDRLNLNRIFPGRPDGTVTEKIADYFTRYLLPMANLVVDMHSGGKTLEFVPFAAAHALPEKDQEARCLAAVEAFAAPYSIRMVEIDNVGMYDTITEQLGKTFVTTELGGGGTSTARTIGIARDGVHNILVHAGILSGTPERRATQWLDMPSDACFTFSEDDGLLEPCLDLGEPVTAGRIVAQVHPADRTGIAPVPYKAALDGILVGRHFPGLVRQGDCLSVIGVPADKR